MAKATKEQFEWRFNSSKRRAELVWDNRLTVCTVNNSGLIHLNFPNRIWKSSLMDEFCIEISRLYKSFGRITSDTKMKDILNGEYNWISDYDVTVMRNKNKVKLICKIQMLSFKSKGTLNVPYFKGKVLSRKLMEKVNDIAKQNIER